jgi:integrase
VKATREDATYRVYSGMCRALEKKFGKTTSLDAIDADAAEAFLHGPQQKGQPWQVGGQRTATHLFRRVWKVGHARTQPWADVALPKKRKVRVAFLKPAEWQALSARHEGLPVHAMLALGCLAGLRLGEMVNLRRDIDVDMDRRVLHIQPRVGEFAWKPKSDNGVRDIPMSAELHRILMQHIEDGYAGERYFIRTDRDDSRVSKSWYAREVRAAFERVGIRWGIAGDGLTTHSLRHTFASWLAQNDVQLLKIARLLGDTVKTVVLYYAHLLPEDLSRAVAVIDTVARAA